MDTQPIFIHGYGAVSTAGLDSSSLYQACLEEADLPVEMQEYPVEENSVSYPGRPVDVKALRKLLPRHPRLRRASNITKFSVAAALQAIPEERVEQIKNHEWRLGIVVSFMNGCVNYSCRFFDEVLKEPALASPILFPETVFNAPASHLAGYLESDGPSYTLIGDSATWFSAITIADEWLATDQVDGCLVLCAEELDRLTAEGLGLYSRNFIATEGAAAIYLEGRPSQIRLNKLHGPFPYTSRPERREAIAEAWGKLDHSPNSLLVDGLNGITPTDRDETALVHTWTGPRLSPSRILGEGMGVHCGFQTIVALEALKHGNPQVNLLASGGNQHAFSALFTT